MPTKATILIPPERREDSLITLVKFDYTGTFVDSITVEVQHFRPTSVEQIRANITARGASEKARLQSIPVIYALIPDIPSDFDTP